MKPIIWLSMTLCGGALVLYGLGSAVMELVGLYSQALADPMADPIVTMNTPAPGDGASTAGTAPGSSPAQGQSSEKQIAGNMFRFALWGAGGAVLFTVGVKGLTLGALRRRRNAEAARGRGSMLGAELEAARARRDAARGS